MKRYVLFTVAATAAGWVLTAVLVIGWVNRKINQVAGALS